ncbi:MAG: hypothetical protein AAF171_12565 [Cyanobacteria bacterium P01_A01_bin.116]
MNNPIARLCLLLSILFLAVFPFAGLAPLTLVLFVAVCGWAFQLASTIISATSTTEPE